MISMSLYNVIFFYIVLCLIYCTYHFLKNSKESAFYRLLIIIIIPVIGLMFFFISDILRKLVKDSGDTISNYEKYIKSDINLNKIKKSNFSDETNIVSLQEALILNKSNVKRKFLIDILKEDPAHYVKSLRKALDDEDTETSHYAATAISELKRTYNISIQKFSREYEMDKSDFNNLVLYLNSLKSYLDSGLLDKKSYVNYKKIYALVLEKVLKNYVKYESYFQEKIKCEIELGNYVKAKVYCIKYFQKHKNKEGPYLMYMNLFYSMHYYDGFTEIFNKLKQSSINLSKEGYDSLQFWLRGDSY